MSDTGEDRPKKLVLRLTEPEWEAVRAGAERDGFDEVEVAIWARRSLLARLGRGDSSKTAPPKAEPPPEVPAEPSSSPSKAPRCSCGMTLDEDGLCDGSCIMRI